MLFVGGHRDVTPRLILDSSSVATLRGHTSCLHVLRGSEIRSNYDSLNNSLASKRQEPSFVLKVFCVEKTVLCSVNTEFPQILFNDEFLFLRCIF
jgi:hypothetical protein